MKKVIMSVGFLMLTGNVCLSEDVNEIFKRAQEFIAAKNYPKALEELTWAKKEIENLNSGAIKGFFPDQLAGFTGGKIEDSSALGIQNLSRTYTKDDNSFEVSLTGGSIGGAGGIGDLAALGRMAAMFQQPGQQSFRISGKTAVLDERNSEDRGEISVYLDSGQILKIESQGAVSHATLKEIAQAIKIEDLDKYLKGK